MKHLFTHQHARVRALLLLFALFAVPLSMSVYGQTQTVTPYSVVFSNNTSFEKDKTVEVPMVAALYRNDKGASIAHTKDNSRWQISLKYDDPRWEKISNGTVYWYIMSPDGKIIGPSSTGEDMDNGKDNSDQNASVPGRMLYKSVDKLKTDGNTSSFTYFKCSKGKDKAVSCTFAYATAAAAYESSSNNGSQLTYGNPSVQYWRNLRGIDYSLTYNATSSSSIDLPYYDGTFCYVKKPTGWGKICAWVYDASNNDKQYSSVDQWPGEELTTTAEYGGQTYYLWRMGSDKEGTPTKIIFNNGDKQQIQQTPGESNAWDFTNGVIYDATDHTKTSNYTLGTVTKQSDATDPTAAYEKFYAYGFWGEGDKSFKKMSPVVYYNANDKNVVDSVVYYVNMSKVNASFDNFFFMFCSQRYMESWQQWKTNDGTGAWDFVWRPEIFDNRDCNALSGALYQAGNDLSSVSGSTDKGASYFKDTSNNPRGFKTADDNKGKNQMQSINPLLTDDQKKNYDSYTLSLNVTTGTYNVEFHNAIQIVGPAVVSGTSWTADAQRNYTSNNATCGTWDKTKAITLKPSDDGTYYFTTVKLKAGEKFRFIENNNYLTNFGEDEVTPSATDFAPENENGDVCYYNHISRNTLTTDEDPNPTGTSGASGLSKGNDITFTMPGLSKDEVYETEIRVSASNPFDQQMTGKAAPFYTISRPVKLFNYGSGNTGYTSFACNYPLEIVSGTDVKVYDIISYDMTTNKVTLRDKSSDYKANSKQYIPAKSGVILSATASDKVSTITVRPMLEKLGETVDNGSNLLKAVYLPGQTINMTLPTGAKNTGDPVDSRQYLFSWVKQNDGNSYKLGFLRSKTGVSDSERAYLSLTGEQVGATTLNPKDKAAYDRVEGISTYDEIGFGAKEYHVNLFFEGSADETVTGIHTFTNPLVNNEGYYTLQGIRLNKPAAAGIYIHNGKKIIVK